MKMESKTRIIIKGIFILSLLLIFVSVTAMSMYKTLDIQTVFGIVFLWATIFCTVSFFMDYESSCVHDSNMALFGALLSMSLLSIAAFAKYSVNIGFFSSLAFFIIAFSVLFYDMFVTLRKGPSFYGIKRHIKKLELKTLEISPADFINIEKFILNIWYNQNISRNQFNDLIDTFEIDNNICEIKKLLNENKESMISVKIRVPQET